MKPLDQRPPNLLPCPYCGGQAEHRYEEVTRTSGYCAVYCRECKAGGPRVWIGDGTLAQDSELGAAQRWNTRLEVLQ